MALSSRDADLLQIETAGVIECGGLGMFETSGVMTLQVSADIACSALAPPFLPFLPGFLNWPCIVDFSNSNFFAALIGSFFGAVGAAVIAERAKTRDIRSQQLRNTNVALTLTFSLANAALTLKKQHVGGMVADYRAAKAAVLDFRQKIATGFVQGNVVHGFTADMRTLPEFFGRVGVLHTLVYEKLSVANRPLSLVDSLGESVMWLNQAIAKRRELIDGFRAAGGPDAAKYFGLPYGDGHRDEEWPDTLHAIELHTDCIIFFSMLLIDDLRAYGLRLTKKLRKWPWDETPSVNEPDFGKAKAAGLMPDPEPFKDWVEAFVERPRRREKVANWIRDKWRLVLGYWDTRK
jgi:hypothetical protein